MNCNDKKIKLFYISPGFLRRGGGGGVLVSVAPKNKFFYLSIAMEVYIVILQILPKLIEIRTFNDGNIIIIKKIIKINYNDISPNFKFTTIKL